MVTQAICFIMQNACLFTVFLHSNMKARVSGKSCPSWHQPRTGYSWLPVQTRAVALLWCYLGCCSKTVYGNKAAANLSLWKHMCQSTDLDGLSIMQNCLWGCREFQFPAEFEPVLPNSLQPVFSPRQKFMGWVTAHWFSSPFSWQNVTEALKGNIRNMFFHLGTC